MLQIGLPMTYLMGGLEFRGGPGEQEVQHGAVGNEITHSLAAGNQLAGLEEQWPAGR